jgi:hypothetical protein
MILHLKAIQKSIECPKGRGLSAMFMAGLPASLCGWLVCLLPAYGLLADQNILSAESSKAWKLPWRTLKKTANYLRNLAFRK